MHALATLRRNRERRAKARARAAFFREAGAWCALLVGFAIALPSVGVLAWLVAAGMSL